MVRRACSSLILGLLLSASGLGYAPAPVYREPLEPKMPDLFAALQGTWEVEQIVNNNAVVVRRGNFIRRTPQPIRIQGTSWAYIFTNNGVETETKKYQIVLDPKASPATLDLKENVVTGVVDGRAIVIDQTVSKGIVRVDGDTLTFCWVSGSLPNAERPKQFFAGNQVMPNGDVAQTLRLKRLK